MAKSEANASAEDDGYARFRAGRKIGAQERLKALSEYIAHYEATAKEHPELLNQKLPRKLLKPILDVLGSGLQQAADKLIKHPEICAFLERNQLPKCLGNELTDEVRVFCLLLNALRQWTVAEQAYMDRFLFSGNIRKEIRRLAARCPVSSETIGPTTKIELHHPVRDGRPPLPLSKDGHDKLEGFVVVPRDDESGQKLVDHRRNSERTYSWKRLRVGCNEENDQIDTALSDRYRSNARSVLRRVKSEVGLTCDEILRILNDYDLGLDE